MAREFDWSARFLDDSLHGWSEMLERAWPAYRRWWLQDGAEVRPPLDLCHSALDRHMHELLPLWERLSAGKDDVQKRFLSFWQPPPYIGGCSQAAVRDPAPLLVRNYDYGPEAFDCLVLSTDWLGRRVVGVSDGLWGLLDGMNDAGLVVSLAFGGRWQIGQGFGIPLILRYVLQTCTTTEEAVRRLRKVPSHMSYNVTCLDRAGRIATVVIAPDRPAEVRETGLATNHQRETPEWPEHARRTQTKKRLSCLRRETDGGASADRLVDRFLRPPLHATGFDKGFGTLYTAAYRPDEGTLTLHWPGLSRRVALDDRPDWDQHVAIEAADAA